MPTMGGGIHRRRRCSSHISFREPKASLSRSRRWAPRSWRIVAAKHQSCCPLQQCRVIDAALTWRRSCVVLARKVWTLAREQSAMNVEAEQSCRWKLPRGRRGFGFCRFSNGPPETWIANAIGTAQARICSNLFPGADWKVHAEAVAIHGKPMLLSGPCRDDEPLINQLKTQNGFVSRRESEERILLWKPNG